MAAKLDRNSAQDGAGSGKPATVLVIHGANLNMLGEREPEVYGRTKLADINKNLKALGRELGLKVDTFQSNSEGALVDRIQRARGAADVLIINAAAHTHTSIAIRDALIFAEVPAIEVHLSNIHRREPFRHRSMIADVARGVIMGLGPDSYYLALRAARAMIDSARNA